MWYKVNTIHSLKHNYPDTLYTSCWHYSQHPKHNIDCLSTYILLYIVNISLLLSDCIHNNLIDTFSDMCYFWVWILICMIGIFMLTGMTCIVMGIGNMCCLSCRMLYCRLYSIGWWIEGCMICSCRHIVGMWSRSLKYTLMHIVNIDRSNCIVYNFITYMLYMYLHKGKILTCILYTNL